MHPVISVRTSTTEFISQFLNSEQRATTENVPVLRTPASTERLEHEADIGAGDAVLFVKFVEN